VAARAFGALAALALAAISAGQATVGPPAELPPERPPERDRYLVTLGSLGEGTDAAAAPGVAKSAGAGGIVTGLETASETTSDAPAPLAGGRLLLFFTPATPEWNGIAPIEGPFLGRLQPVQQPALVEGGRAGGHDQGLGHGWGPRLLRYQPNNLGL